MYMAAYTRPRLHTDCGSLGHGTRVKELGLTSQVKGPLGSQLVWRLPPPLCEPGRGSG